MLRCGMRGASALPAAVDTLIRVDKGGSGNALTWIRVEIMRAIEEGEAMYFEKVPEVVEQRGEPVETMRLMLTDQRPSKQDGGRKGKASGKAASLDKRRAEMLDLLVAIVDTRPVSQPQLIDGAAGRTKNKVWRLVLRLRDEGLLERDGKLTPTAEGIALAATHKRSWEEVGASLACAAREDG